MNAPRRPQAVRRPADLTPSEFDAWRTALEDKDSWLDVVIGVLAFVSIMAVFGIIALAFVDFYRFS